MASRPARPLLRDPYRIGGSRSQHCDWTARVRRLLPTRATASGCPDSPPHLRSLTRGALPPTVRKTGASMNYAMRSTAAERLEPAMRMRGLEPPRASQAGGVGWRERARSGFVMPIRVTSRHRSAARFRDVWALIGHRKPSRGWPSRSAPGIGCYSSHRSILPIRRIRSTAARMSTSERSS
jgi:hypothetical protein